MTVSPVETAPTTDTTATTAATAAIGSPIFVLGIMRRSGTNYLHDLLSLHPDCCPSSVPEDFLLSNAPVLLSFVRSLYASWSPSFNVPERLGPPPVLSEQLGNVLLRFLLNHQHDPVTSPLRASDRPPAATFRLLSHTPSVENIAHVYDLFPSARLLIIVRDGRDLIESGVRSFGWPYEEAMRKWNTAARSILAFQQQCPSAARQSLVVRYEDLVTDPSGMLRRILAFLDLDPDRYDFDAALRLPVRGSSTFGRPPGQPVHWQPVARDPSFNPLERAAHWDQRKLCLFDHIAGESMTALGYVRDGTSEHASPAEKLHYRICRARWTWRSKVSPRIALVTRAIRYPAPDLYDRGAAYFILGRSRCGDPPLRQTRHPLGPASHSP